MQRFGPRKLGVPQRAGAPKKKQFEGFRATELYCPNCRSSMPVRERLLLVLPEGEKYEYLCARCGTSVGDKLVTGEPKPLIVVG
jgi:DNA-directed RNA polymerase subunit RPC12/RpoP